MTYKIQIDDVVRDATAGEAAVIDAQLAEAQAQVDAQASKVIAKAAVIAKLGLTADEVTALLS